MVCILLSSFSEIIEDCLRLQFIFTKEFYARENSVFIIICTNISNKVVENARFRKSTNSVKENEIISFRCIL